jgi:hypothetical protein
VSAIDIHPAPEPGSITGHFTFLGEVGASLIGRDVGELVAATKGRADFVPAALAEIVGKKCTVVAEVAEDCYNADPGVLYFKVPKCEVITAPNIAEPSSSQSTQQENLTESQQATPPKDVL